MAQESVPPTPDESRWQASLPSNDEPARTGRQTSPPPRRRGRNPSRSRPYNPPGNEADWARAAEDMANHRILELPVVGCNKGGVLVSYHSIVGFVPTSHMLNLPRLPDIEERLQVLSQKIGETLRLRIIEIDRERGRLILSERAALEDENALRLWETLKPGDVLDGRVTRLEPYGAFVDIGGVEGLVHVSELAWTRVRHPAEVVQPGDQVKVYVIAVKPHERKVALSVKRLLPDPWDGVADRYHPGDVVEGVVTHLTPFGAFVHLEEGVEGLVHRTQLADPPPRHPKDVVSVGQTVRVRVLDVDEANRRIALSLL